MFRSSENDKIRKTTGHGSKSVCVFWAEPYSFLTLIFFLQSWLGYIWLLWWEVWKEDIANINLRGESTTISVLQNKSYINKLDELFPLNFSTVFRLAELSFIYKKGGGNKITKKVHHSMDNKYYHSSTRVFIYKCECTLCFIQLTRRNFIDLSFISFNSLTVF